MTEISTPISTLDLAVVSDSIPATPAQNATITENQSGLAMTSASPWSAELKSSGVRPVAR